MRRPAIAVMLTLGACGGPLQTVPVHLESGHYAGVDVRLPMAPPSAELQREVEAWSLEVDAGARRLVLDGPGGSVTRTLVPVDPSRLPRGCRAGRWLSTMDAFTTEGPLVIAGAEIAEPFVIAQCPGKRVTIRDRAHADENGGPEVTFDRR